MDKLNILMFASSAGVGLTYYLTDLSIGLERGGHKVIVLHNGKEQIPGLINLLNQEGIISHTCAAIDELDPYSVYSASKYISSISELEDIDVIHVNGFSHLFKAYLSTQSSVRVHKKQALVLTNHSSNTYLSPWMKQLIPLAGKMADVINPLCNSSKNILLQLGVPNKKIMIVPNALDLQHFDWLSNQEFPNLSFLEYLKGETLIAYIAMLRPLKGHYYYFLAAKEVIKEYPNVKFLVVGDGPFRSQLEQFTTKLNIENNVLFTGLIRNVEIPHFIKSIDVGVSSSLAEQFPHTILELMASCKPIVSTAVGGIPDIVENGKTGYIVAPEDYLSMSEKIINILQDHQAATVMGKNARAIIEKEFDMPVVVSKLTELYRYAICMKFINQER